MKFFKFPIITLTTSFILGIIFNSFFEPNIGYLNVAITVAFLISILAYIRAKKKWFQDVYFGIAAYFLFFCLGSEAHYWHTDSHYENHYSNFLTDTNETIIKGSIVSVLKPSENFHKYIVSLSQYNDTSCFGKILVYNDKTNAILKSGQEIIIIGKLLPTFKATNPYQFDYSAYLEKLNISHQVFCRKGSVITTRIHKNTNYYIQNIREKLIASFDEYQFDAKTKSILEALLFGQRNVIDEETIANYSNAGVIHILAISGLHIGILYFFFSLLLKPLEKRKYGSIIRLFLILGLLWLFALLTGLPASVTRAVTLFSFVSLGTFYNRQNHAFNAVAVSALLLLLFNPNYIFDIGFQLSYAAVISILLFQPFYEKCYFTKHKIGVYFIDIVLVSLAAQIGVLPLTLYYFHQLPLLFLLANIVVIPLGSFVLILGCVLLLLNFIFKSLALLLGKILSFLIATMNQYIAVIATFDSGVIKNISFTSEMVILSYLIILFFIYWCYKLKWFAFRNMAIALLLFQISLIYIEWTKQSTDELIVFNSKKTLLSAKKGNQVQFFSHDSVFNEETIKNYKRGLHTNHYQINALQNVMSYHDNRILIVDQMGVFEFNLKADYVVLTQNPKINLVRLIEMVQPKEIIADNSNFYYLIDQWERTCKQKNIPFHATAEKGYYRLK
ncbi:ComEC/Rec2 family competence protein [Flavobacterium sp. NRK F7]|uniref:ComEC/Rec2 family competence protein n=1 Tax=Flavobacterium sp. NRK F7 TaxID=2954930 RepID=UPI0020917196|nr:ComEC/Rec2 family competence protein [Flavobacterium sp. NRK F7]MCO6162079.1 ComEC family competence protein [Flavobacterium sp. NRK F7]